MRLSYFALLSAGIVLVLACSSENDLHDYSNRDLLNKEVTPRQGNLANHGGTPTVRKSYYAPPDDPETTNNESNDQPLGHFGTVTLTAYSVQSGNEYTLDADVDGFVVERVYFPRGGWIDFSGCELDENLTGECDDEEGRSWEFRGESTSATSSELEDDDGDDAHDEDDNSNDGDDDNGDDGRDDDGN